MFALVEKDMQLEQLMPLIKERLAAGNTVRFSPRGISMLPMLRQGIDSVVFSPLPEKLNKYDLPLYQRRDVHYVLHRVVDVGDTYTCIGDNQYVLEPGLEHEQMIALVTAFYRGDRKHSVTEPGYLIYTRLWHWSRGLRHFCLRGKNWLRRHLKK